jgi:putative peptidoglycan lipid II flippase
VIPFSSLFIVLNNEIIMLLFQRGQFDTNATLLTAGILPFFMIGAFAFAAQNIVSRGYYAVQNTVFPAIFTSICVALSFPLILFLMKIMGPRGVALGLSLSVIIQAFALFECWNKKTQNTEKKEVYLFFIKMIPTSMIIGFILYVTAFFLKSYIETTTYFGAIILVVLIGIEFAILFFFTGSLFKISEIHNLYGKIFKKLLPWMK